MSKANKKVRNELPHTLVFRNGKGKLEFTSEGIKHVFGMNITEDDVKELVENKDIPPGKLYNLVMRENRESTKDDESSDEAKEGEIESLDGKVNWIKERFKIKLSLDGVCDVLRCLDNQTHSIETSIMGLDVDLKLCDKHTTSFLENEGLEEVV